MKTCLRCLGDIDSISPLLLPSISHRNFITYAALLLYDDITRRSFTFSANSLAVSNEYGLGTPSEGFPSHHKFQMVPVGHLVIVNNIT